jgi:hypothetical protein
MVEILRLSAEMRPGLYDRFVDGALLRHADGTVVRFEDEVWVTHPQGQSKSRSFKGVADWIIPWGKRLVAQAWLVEDKGQGTLCGYASTLRKVSCVLNHFPGPIEELNPDHAEHVRFWVIDQWQARERALYALGQELGRHPTEKEVRSLRLRPEAGLSAYTCQSVVTMLQKIVSVAEAAGAQVDCRFTFPKLVGQRNRAVGSASPEKVLNHEQLAALINGAIADIDEYRQLADELHAEVQLYVDAAHSMKSMEGRTGHAAVLTRRLQRYFGVDGAPMESIGRIAQDEGITPAGLARTLKKGLVRSVGADEAKRLMKTRRRATERGVSGTSNPNRAAARAEIRAYFEDNPLDPDVGQISLKDSANVIAKLFGVGCPIHSTTAVAVTPKMVQARLKALNTWVHGEEAAQRAKNLWERRGLLANRLDRAIKACGLLLQIVSYRRVSALIESLSADLEGRWVAAPNGDRVFELDFTARKMWGPRGLPERIPLPGYFGEVAERALSTAKELTAPLRDYALPEHRNVLLLSRDRTSWLRPSPLRAIGLSRYLNHPGRDGGGLVHRRNLKSVQHVTLHFFRHTAATAIITEGGSAIAVADLLGNTPQMTGTFYFSGGSEQLRDEAKAAAERGATAGFLVDAVNRIAQGDTDKGASSQLPYDIALQRILDTPEFVQDYLDDDGNFGPEQARAMLGAGIVINVTRYGGCALPVEEGYCPALDSCPIGCDPERNQKDPNCGCRWAVKIPHFDAINSYEEAIAVMAEQLDEIADQKRFAAFRGPLKQRMAIFQAQLETLYRLRDATSGEDA